MITGFYIELLPIYSIIYHLLYYRSIKLTSLLVFFKKNIQRGFFESVSNLAKAMVQTEHR